MLLLHPKIAASGFGRKLRFKGLDKSCNVLQLYCMKNNARVRFGAFVKGARMKKRITAKHAAESAGMLPSNFSKLEHGLFSAPREADKQKKLAAAIGVLGNPADEARFFDLAAEANKAVAVDIADLISREEALPLLLRTIGNKRLGSREIERLVEIVRGTK